jgi:hypothetical protein
MPNALHNALATLPLDKIKLDRIRLGKFDTKALAKIDTSKVAPIALMLARRSWPLAIAIGVGAAAYTAYRYSQTHKVVSAA